MRDLSRRNFVQGTGAVIAAGALAGCSGNGDGNGNGNGGNGNGNGNGGDDSLEGRLDSFLEGGSTNNYDGDITDEHGQSEVVVEVGAGDNGFAFNPAALAVDVGTTVVWEWTGAGGGHNVSSEGESDFDFESERTDEEGFTFEQTFDEEGLAAYVCTPHRAQGMYGAVIVE